MKVTYLAKKDGSVKVKKKKPKKRDPVKTLHNKAWKIARQITLQRDGSECQVLKYYPHLEVAHTNIMQADHCFGRANKWLFYETRNLTCVCSGCNNAKGFKLKSVHRAIDEIVRKREGEEWYQAAKQLDMTFDPHPNWKHLWWIESIVEMLKEQLEDL